MPPQANKKLSSKMAWFELLVGPATMDPASIQAFVTAVCDRSMPPSHLPPHITVSKDHAAKAKAAHITYAQGDFAREHHLANHETLPELP